MFILDLLATKVFEIGLTIVDEIAGTIEQGFRTTVFGAKTYQGEDESAIALVLRNNSNAMQLFAESQMSLVEVQHRQNELKQIELMMTAELAQQERELKAHLSELWRDLKRELQQNELTNRQDLQNRQIQSDWDKIKLPTVFSRQELESLAQDTSRPLFVCAKMQITEGCPDYFRTELVADTESQIKKFANLVFQGNVRFYSRFFDDENIFDTNAAQLRSIIPNVPSVMSFSKVTRRKAYLHYQLWGSRSAEIFNGNFDVELPWREVAQQLRDESKDASISDDDLYEIIGDWLTTLQKIYAVFFIDLYAIIDGDDPFYAIKLNTVNFGIPEQTTSQYIQPLAEILQRFQNERINAFNEQLRRQQEEEENRQRHKELQKQEELLKKQKSEARRQALTFDLPNGGGKLEFVFIPAGKLIMDGHHEIKLSEFAISKYPITQREYEAIMGNNPSHFTSNYTGSDGKLYLASDRPVEQVLWQEAKAFCENLSKHPIFQGVGLKISLPSETQWEYACRDGADPYTQTNFWFGNDSHELIHHAWYHQNSCSMTHSVKEREDKNTSENFKLVDMHGNVWEWCVDNYTETISDLPTKGQSYYSVVNFGSHSARGGSWRSTDTLCHSFYRGGKNADDKYYHVGFRVVLSSAAS